MYENDQVCECTCTRLFGQRRFVFFFNCPSPCFGVSGRLSLAKMDDRANYEELRPVSPQRTGLLAAHWSVRGSARPPNISARNGNTGWGRKEIWFHACMHRHTCACWLTNMHTNKQNSGGWGVRVACGLQRVSGNKKHQMHWCITIKCSLNSSLIYYCRYSFWWLGCIGSRFRRYPKFYIMALSK